MDEDKARARFASARVAGLETVRPDGAPHVYRWSLLASGDSISDRGFLL